MNPNIWHEVPALDDSKPKQSYRVCFRDSTVIFDYYTFEASSARRAVKKARKFARKEGHDSWSVYFVQESWDDATRQYGPFPYNRKWGKS